MAKMGDPHGLWLDVQTNPLLNLGLSWFLGNVFFNTGRIFCGIALGNLRTDAEEHVSEQLFDDVLAILSKFFFYFYIFLGVAIIITYGPSPMGLPCFV